MRCTLTKSRTWPRRHYPCELSLSVPGMCVVLPLRLGAVAVPTLEMQPGARLGGVHGYPSWLPPDWSRVHGGTAVFAGGQAHSMLSWAGPPVQPASGAKTLPSLAQIWRLCGTTRMRLAPSHFREYHRV